MWLSSAGYSVIEEKKLLSRDEYTVVTGSPRDGSKGSVVFGAKTDKNIEMALIIPGEQVGSYFGNSLTVTDLNNDEYVNASHTENTNLLSLLLYNSVNVFYGTLHSADNQFKRHCSVSCPL